MLSAAVPLLTLLTSLWNMTELLAVRTEYVILTVLAAPSLFPLPCERGAFLDHQCTIHDLILQWIYLEVHTLDQRIWSNQQSNFGLAVVVKSLLCRTSSNARSWSINGLLYTFVVLNGLLERFLVACCPNYHKRFPRLNFCHVNAKKTQLGCIIELGFAIGLLQVGHWLCEIQQVLKGFWWTRDSFLRLFVLAKLIQKGWYYIVEFWRSVVQLSVLGKLIKEKLKSVTI